MTARILRTRFKRDIVAEFLPPARPRTASTMKPRIIKDYYDIVILPPPAIRDRAIALSREVAAQGGKFRLEQKSFLPHCSLYHIKVKPGQYAAFRHDLVTAVRGFRARSLQVQGVKFWSDGGCAWQISKPAWIEQLYLHIIHRTIRHFDFAYGVQRLWNGDWLTPQMRKYLRQYGTPMVGRYFRPHLTLTLFNPDVAETVAHKSPRLHIPRTPFRPTGVAIGYLGPHHQVMGIKDIMRFNIKSVAYSLQGRDRRDHHLDSRFSFVVSESKRKRSL